MEDEDLISMIAGITHWDSSSWSYRTENFFNITPFQFLQYAKIDFKLRDNQSFINALSNIKRCLDCQVDCLLKVFGYYEISKKKRWGFPDKIELLNRLGILSPSILNKINAKRNLVEHEYKFPKEEEVNDAIDIAELFLESTNNFILKVFDHLDYEFNKDKNIPSEFWDVGENVSLNFDHHNKIFELYYSRKELEEKHVVLKEEKKLIINMKNDNYDRILSIFLKGIKTL